MTKKARKKDKNGYNFVIFLAKPLGKYGITLLHVTYPPLS